MNPIKPLKKGIEAISKASQRAEEQRREATKKAIEAAKKGLGQRAAEAKLKKEQSARDKAIIEAAEASKRGFLGPSKEKERWFRGTTKDEEVIPISERGFISLTKDPEFASEYAGSIEEGTPNVMPLYAQTRNPFDYENPEHIEAVLSRYKKPESVSLENVKDQLELGNWNFIEDKNVQQAIKDAGFDAFYMKEQGLKNLGVFDPKRVKSATGMQGAYDITNPEVTKARGGVVDNALKAWHEQQMAKGGEVRMQEGGDPSISASPQNPMLRAVARALKEREKLQSEMPPTMTGTVLDLLLPSAETVEKWSYGDNPFRLNPSAGRSYARQADVPYMLESAGIAASALPFVKPAAKAMAATPPLGTLQLGKKTAPKSPLGFYSAVEETVVNLPQAKGTGDQFLAQIKNTPGVKPDEIEWTGLDSFLSGKKSVTRDDIQEYLAKNKVDVQEVQLAGSWDDFRKIRRAEFESYDDELLADQANIPFGPRQQAAFENEPGFREKIIDKLVEADVDYYKANPGDLDEAFQIPKFSGYSVPGGKNYREILLKLPEKEPSEAEVRAILGKPEGAKLDVYDFYHAKRMFEGNFQTPHFEPTNILAHLRVNDRVVDGKKTLFIEEIQSDWHQAGRKRGYKDPKLAEKERELIEEANKVARAAGFRNALHAMEGWQMHGIEKAKEASDLYVAARQQGVPTNAVPNAPFKTTWHELALKRAIQEAAEKGYEKIAFTTGKTQVERYPEALRQVADDISWKSSGTPESGNRFIEIKKSGNTVLQAQVDNRGIVTSASNQEAVGKPIEDLIGKPMGQQIVSEPSGSIKGEQFTVGGKGMEGFYDDILPKNLNKLGKKFDTKVKKEQINTRIEDDLAIKLKENGYDPYSVELQQILSDNQGRRPEWLSQQDIWQLESGYQPSIKDDVVDIWSMDITPKMRESVTTKGQPLFQVAPAIPAATLLNEEEEMAQGGAVSPEVLGGGTGIPYKDGGNVTRDKALMAWAREQKKAAGGSVDQYQRGQAQQAQRSSDIQAYKQGRIGADELVKHFPGLTAAMVEAQLSEPEMKAGGEVKMQKGGLQTIRELMEGRNEPLAQPEIKALPQSPLQQFGGFVGRGLESLGKTISEPLEELGKTHPIRSTLAEFFIADPLRSAGTALQDWTGTPRDVSDEYPFTPSPFYGGPTLETFKFDPRSLDVLGLGQVGVASLPKAARKLVMPGESPLPVGLSTEPVGTPMDQVIKPTKEVLKAPADDLGFYSAMEKAALNIERKQGSGEAFLNDLRKGGASKEELQYSGMEDYLKSKKSITREDVQDFAKANRYEFSEVEYKQGQFDEDQFSFSSEVIDDHDYISQRADDIESDYDELYPEMRGEIRDDIESRFDPEELQDPVIQDRIEREVNEAIREKAYQDATDEYYENPTYSFTNDANYEIIGNDDSGYTVRAPDGRAIGEFHRNFESAEGAARQHAMDQGLVDAGETQYHDYQLPNGENYREILVQRSTTEGPFLTSKERARYLDLSNRNNDHASGVSKEPLSDIEQAELADLKERISLANKRQEFTRSHWDEPDVMLHMRVQDRTTTDGKPMLYVDEMQSDWHQKGLEQGYYSKEVKEKLSEMGARARAARQEISVAMDKRDSLSADLRRKFEDKFYDENRRMPSTREVYEHFQSNPEWQKLDAVVEEKRKIAGPLIREVDKLLAAEEIPDAPFKENWHELGMKRAIAYAARNGYDRIGFSSANPQIKRWGTQEIAWEKTPKLENTKENFTNWMKSKVQEDVRPEQFDEAINDAYGNEQNSVYRAFLKEVEKPQGWKVAATEQRGGIAGRIDLEAEARARGVLKTNRADSVTSQEELRKIIDSSVRGMSEDQIDRITKKTWERMQKYDTGVSAPREEGMRAFYDNKLKNALEKYAKKMGGEFYETTTSIGRGVTEGGGYGPVTEPVYVIELTPKLKDSAKKGQSYKKGGLVEVPRGWKFKGSRPCKDFKDQKFARGGKVKRDEALMAWAKEQKMAAGGVAKAAPEAAKAVGSFIQDAVTRLKTKFADEAIKNNTKPIASEKVIENTVNKSAEKIAKKNPKLSDEDVAKRAERETAAKLKWERAQKPTLEKQYGELEKAAFDEPLQKRQRNVPGVVEERIRKAEEFLSQPTEPWTPPRQELQAFDRALIKDALEGFPGIEQTRFPRYNPARADLSYIEEIYGDPRNRALIEKQIKRGLPLGGETFYASLYPVKAAALERGIPAGKFEQFIYETAPASARNSILNEMAVGQFLRDMKARGLPLDEKTVTQEMAKFKEKYGVGLPLMPVHREGVKAVIEGPVNLREQVIADIPTNYKIPTYGTQKAGDFGKSMVLDVHESAGQTMGSRYHPYFTEQGGFGPTEYGLAESKMLDIAESMGLPGGMAQAGRWFGGGELTGLKSPRGDALDLLEKQAAYTLQGLGIKPTRAAIRNYVLDMIETGEGVLMPYFKSQPLPDVRTKKDGGLMKKKRQGGLAHLA